MKKFLILLISIFFIAPAPAQAANHTIWLATTANRNYSGEIINKNFEKSLAVDGDLGKVVFNPTTRPRTWVMDAALLEDVQSLVDKKSTVATKWMTAEISAAEAKNIRKFSSLMSTLVWIKLTAPHFFRNLSVHLKTLSSI